MDVISISPSGYSKYEFCEFQYYLRYIIGAADLSIPSGILGKTAHEVMEKLSIENINKEPFSDPWILWDQIYKKQCDYEPEIAAKIKQADLKKVKAAFQNLLDDRIHSPLYADIIMAERPITIKIPELDLDVNGVIDRVQIRKEDGKKEIWDLKSGRLKSFTTGKDVSEETMWDNIQIKIYTLAAHLMFPDEKEFYATLYYMQHRPITIKASDMLVSDILEELSVFVNKVRNNNNPKRNTGWHCKNICSFGSKTSICDSVYNDITVFGREITTEIYSLANNQEEKRIAYKNGETKFNSPETIIGEFKIA